MKWKRLLSGIAVAAALGFWLTAKGGPRARPITMGKQPDGAYIVSTGQRIEPGAIRFRGRPSDLALHPSGRFFAVLNHHNVFLCGPRGLLPNAKQHLGAGAGFHGLTWTPDGRRLIASTDKGYLQIFDFDGVHLRRGRTIVLDRHRNAVPGGMAVTRDGRRLYVAAADLNQVLEVDLATTGVLRHFDVENLPFEPRLTPDERTLVVSNWGGRIAKADDRTAKSEDADIVVDSRGAPASGTVSFVDLKSGKAKSLGVGIHPSSIALANGCAYVANSMSDSISEIDLKTRRVRRTLPIRWGGLQVIGAMPVAIAVRGGRLFACDGGDNALAELDLNTGRVLGFRPAGYFPIAMALHGDRAIVLNSKGNGSVANTAYGRVGKASDFEGTVSMIDLRGNLAAETVKVANDNGWNGNPWRPRDPVYTGAIRHVLYVIKENRTYDEIFGDVPEGDGDPSLCSIGARIMPNHHALAREFTLFDNAYVSGTNSADGHAWATQSLANDYLEHFYVGYSRTYPMDGDCAMSISNGGCLWDAAAKKHKSIRVYGEFCDDALAEYHPRKPNDWFEAWEDRKCGAHRFTYVAHTRVAGLKPYIDPAVHYWPLIQSDQARADEFIRDYGVRSREGKVPNLMILSLPCDHTQGADPDFPTPRAMLADNDLALGRVVEAVSKSPEWKSTCIFVIEDDAQSGPDHVDGHRTCYMVISPYNRRHTVDHNLYTTTNMVRSIEMMLGLSPMNRFDALAKPIDTCFTNRPDLTPYAVQPNLVALDEPNPGHGRPMTHRQRFWARQTRRLDWSHPDGPDSYRLNRIIWASLHPDGRPYPGRPGEHPGQDHD